MIDQVVKLNTTFKFVYSGSKPIYEFFINNFAYGLRSQDLLDKYNVKDKFIDNLLSYLKELDPSELIVKSSDKDSYILNLKSPFLEFNKVDLKIDITCIYNNLKIDVFTIRDSVLKSGDVVNYLIEALEKINIIVTSVSNSTYCEQIDSRNLEDLKSKFKNFIKIIS